MSPHLLLGAAPVDKQKQLQKLPDGVLLLMAVADAGVFRATRCQGDEIIVMCDENAAVGKGEGKLLFIGGTDQPGFDRGGDVDAVAAKPYRNRGTDAFIQMVSNHRGRP